MLVTILFERFSNGYNTLLRLINYLKLDIIRFKRIFDTDFLTFDSLQKFQ